MKKIAYWLKMMNQPNDYEKHITTSTKVELEAKRDIELHGLSTQKI
jgi:hypothetical protein